MPELVDTLVACAREIGEAVVAHRGRGHSGARASQYHLDVAADEVAVRVLTGAGYRVVSEESGVSGDGDVTIVVDPIDGSTNCDRGVPFYATSLAALRGVELVAGVVVNQATGECFSAEVGAGATRDGVPVAPSDQGQLAGALMCFSGYPARHAGWSQIRALGAAALEICLVADGSLDLFAVARESRLHPWDYLAGICVARESGAAVGEYDGAELVTDEPVARRLVVAATPALLESALAFGRL
ncbi:MAG TPA: inositol monophosphatase [Acidimicrobiales bacterium]|nr:inositol monophosphatase [Acidimicrobiales bacterium]